MPVLGHQLAVLNVFHKVGRLGGGRLCGLEGGQGQVWSRCMVRPRLRKRSRAGKGGLPATTEDGRLLETCTWEMMRAERGTWDASVGLSALMRDSIFSASLLQASICKGKGPFDVKPQRPEQVQAASSWHMSERQWPQSPFVLARATVTMALTYLIHARASWRLETHRHCPRQSAIWVCTVAPHTACLSH